MKNDNKGTEYLFFSFAIFSLMFSVFNLANYTKLINQKELDIYIILSFLFFSVCFFIFLAFFLYYYFSSQKNDLENYYYFLEQDNLDSGRIIFRNKREIICGTNLYFLKDEYFAETCIDSIDFLNNSTVIGKSVFHNCKHLRRIKLPSNLFSIKESTFKDCTSLKSINIPNSLKTIGETAFMNCVALKNISIPENVEEIGKDAFSGCNNIVLAFQTDDERKVKQLLKEANVTENTSIIFQGAKSTVKEFVTKANN